MISISLINPGCFLQDTFSMQHFRYIIILLIVICLTTGFGKHAYPQVRQARREMELYHYTKAIDILTRSSKKRNCDTSEVKLLIAECYRKQLDFQHAATWYARIVETQPVNPVILYNYAQALRSCGEYRKAKMFMLKYLELIPDDKHAQSYADFCDSIEGWKTKRPLFEINNATSLNSVESDFGVVIFEDGLIFTSDRFFSSNPEKKYGWSGNSYLRLYYSKLESQEDDSVGFSPPQLAPIISDRLYHYGPVTFSADFNEMFVNCTYLYPDKGKKDPENMRTHLLKIFSSVRDQGKWSAPKPFFLNSDEYSVGHPCLSPDGNTLYFVSDMKGGLGGTDLYQCTRENGKWGPPVNLGPGINTFGNEMFPYSSATGELYFSSDGWPGFGGLDIFVSKKSGDHWSTPKNLFEPINSSFDDFSFSFSRDYTAGFFCSNRPGGKGSDDIYQFRKLPPVKKSMQINPCFLSGFVKEKTTRLALRDATVFILNIETSEVLVLKTDFMGYFRAPAIRNRAYVIKAMSKGYVADCLTFTMDSATQVSERTISRYLLLDQLQINRKYVVDNIYYDLDSWSIRTDAMPALDNLVALMKENPVTIELGSHTDSRASDAYNLELSQHRAESARQYLILRGIDPARIVAKGYGESQPVNRCMNGIPCSEAEHQQNRRTEFKVISLDDEIIGTVFDLSAYHAGDVIHAGQLPENFFKGCK